MMSAHGGVLRQVTEEEFAATLAKKKEEMEAACSKEVSIGSSSHW